MAPSPKNGSKQFATPCCRPDPGLLQPLQNKSLSSQAVTSKWQKLKFGIITGFKISVTLFPCSDELDSQVCRARVQGPLKLFRDMCTSHQGFHVWPGSHHRFSSRIQVDHAGVGETHLVGLDELQDGQVKITCANEGLSHGQVPLQHWLVANPKPFQRGLWKALAQPNLDSWQSSVHQLEPSAKCEYTSVVYSLPWILWPLLVSSVETLGWKVSSYLRRWLVLPISLCNTALYGNKTMLQLPLKSLE